MDLPVTTVSPEGHIVLPENIRSQQHWEPGTRLVIESTGVGVLLRREDEELFPETKPADVFGMLKYDGPPVSIEDMNNAIAIEVQRRRDSGRY